MIKALSPQPLACPHQGSPRTIRRVEGARNTRQKLGYQRQLFLATYNIRTLSFAEKLQELEEELFHIKWDILGLSEQKRQLILRSGNMFNFRGGDDIN